MLLSQCHNSLPTVNHSICKALWELNGSWVLIYCFMIRSSSAGNGSGQIVLSIYWHIQIALIIGNCSFIFTFIMSNVIFGFTSPLSFSCKLQLTILPCFSYGLILKWRTNTESSVMNLWLRNLHGVLSEKTNRKEWVERK